MCLRENIYGIETYNPPKSLISEAEYRERVIALGKDKNLTFADDEFFCDFENLRNDLYDMITYSTKEIDVTGTKYYVANNGNDNADGLTPETAWKTLQKVTEFEFKEGDGVYFKRDNLWRGNVILQSGVTYQAYGAGAKPKIWYSENGANINNWQKTDIENVWVYTVPFPKKDIGVIVFDGGKKYAEKQRTLSEVKNELDFCHKGHFSNENEENQDNLVYLYCSKGNPSVVFKEIELSLNGSTVTIPSASHDITLHNLDVRYGQDYFFKDNLKNITVSYCVFAWMGGHYFGKGGCRYGGGGGCWFNCDNITLHHCFFTQHFDCSASPQFHGDADKAGYFNNYSMRDCLVEYTEYSFEYFSTKKNGDDYGFNNLYLGYNIYSKCGKGFGDKHFASRHIKAWGHSNPCFNSVFEHNIFDRAHTLSIEYTSRESKDTFYNGGGDRVSYERLPKLRENIFIEPKDKPFADINQLVYKFNEAAQITLKLLGAQENDIYVFDGKFEK